MKYPTIAQYFPISDIKDVWQTLDIGVGYYYNMRLETEDLTLVELHIQPFVSPIVSLFQINLNSPIYLHKFQLILGLDLSLNQQSKWAIDGDPEYGVNTQKTDVSSVTRFEILAYANNLKQRYLYNLPTTNLILEDFYRMRRRYVEHVIFQAQTLTDEASGLLDLQTKKGF